MRDLVQARDVDCIESRGSRGHGLKERGQQLLRYRHAEQDVVELKEEQRDRSGRQQEKGHQQGKARVQRDPEDRAPRSLPEDIHTEHIRYDDEADPSQHDQPDDDRIDREIPPVSDQAVGEQGKSRVAERGHGMEQRPVRAAGDSSQLRAPAGQKQEEPCQFGDERHPHDVEKDLPEIPGMGRVHDLLHGSTSAHAHGSSEDQRHRGRDRHNAQAPDLDQHQNHRLAEPGEVRGGILDDEPGDTCRGRRGEQRIHKTPAGFLLGGRPWKRQEERPQTDDTEEAQGQELRRLGLESQNQQTSPVRPRGPLHRQHDLTSDQQRHRGPEGEADPEPSQDQQ